MASSGDMKGITNADLCGIFLGDLVSHTAYGSPVLQEYEAMPTFGCATREPVSCSVNCFITQKAVQRGVADRCFQLMMAMWSWEGSMRMRYGEYRVDWTDPSADGTCAYGIAPVFKLLDDPFMKAYISIQKTAEQDMKEYEAVKKSAEDAKRKVYPFVKTWFLGKYKGFNMADAKKAITQAMIDGAIQSVTLVAFESPMVSDADNLDDVA
jgi:hypothetical protein